MKHLRLLAAAGAGLERGSGNIRKSLCAIALPLFMVVGATDAQATIFWLGGAGNWSDSSKWSGGGPGTDATDSVTIYSGGIDNVTLDVSATTEQLLTLGSVDNGFTSTLGTASAQTLNASGGMTIGQQGILNLDDGSTLSSPFVDNSGTVNIDATSLMAVGAGPSSGQGFSVLANGTLGEVIGGGVINITGSASLNGTLDVILQNGDPAVGTVFTILTTTPGELTGQFANVLNDVFNNGTEFWQVSYDNADGDVTLTAEANGIPAVPEPSSRSLMLLGAGLAGAVAVSGRKTKAA